MQAKEYLKGIIEHDKKTIEYIYARYAHRIQQHVIKNGGTVEDAKDIFNDALMIVYEKAKSPDFVLTSQFYTYLFGICRFIWDRKRRKKTNQTVTIPDDDGLVLDQDSITESLERRERHKVFESALQKLGSVCQEILRLFFIEHSMEQIAEKMNLKNAHTARTRKYRCQQKLEGLIKQDVRYYELRNSNAKSDV